MIIKLEKVISCTSEHPSYPASNLLQQRANSSWRCAKPGELLASVIFQFAEASTITGLDIGNYRSCIVVVTASTSDEPDNWIPVINHQFMNHDDAANGKFRDQVQLFSKKELNAETTKIKFSRAKVTCMQSANLRELFGLSFVVLRTQVALQIGADIFGRFKLKDSTPTLDSFKEKCTKQIPEERPSYKETLAKKIKEESADSFAKRQENPGAPAKRPILDKLEEEARKKEAKAESARSSKVEKSESDAGSDSSSCDKRRKDLRTPAKRPTFDKSEEKTRKEAKDEGAESSKVEKRESDAGSNSSRPVARSPFGDVINSDKKKGVKKKKAVGRSVEEENLSEKGRSKEEEKKRVADCTQCQNDRSEDTVCERCDRLFPEEVKAYEPPAKKAKVAKKPTKQFAKLFEDVTFAMSGYVNPQRDEIRKKALKMGGKYVADPNTTDNKCSHLICAFKNTPKFRQLEGHTKIVSRRFIEDCFQKKKRLPWRRFALINKEKAEPESEEEIEGVTRAVKPPNPYQEDTDVDSDY